MNKSWFITIQIVVKCKSLTKFAQFLQQKKLTTQNISEACKWIKQKFKSFREFARTTLIMLSVSVFATFLNQSKTQWPLLDW